MQLDYLVDETHHHLFWDRIPKKRERNGVFSNLLFSKDDFNKLAEYSGQSPVVASNRCNKSHRSIDYSKLIEINETNTNPYNKSDPLTILRNNLHLRRWIDGRRRREEEEEEGCGNGQGKFNMGVVSSGIPLKLLLHTKICISHKSEFYSSSVSF